MTSLNNIKSMKLDSIRTMEHASVLYQFSEIVKPVIYGIKENKSKMIMILWQDFR